MHHGRQKHANQMPDSPQHRHVRATPSQHPPPLPSLSTPPAWSWQVTTQVGPIARGMKGTEGIGWEKLGSDGRVGKVPIRRQGGWRTVMKINWGFLSSIMSCNRDGAFSFGVSLCSLCSLLLSHSLTHSRSHSNSQSIFQSLSLPFPISEIWPTLSRSPHFHFEVLIGEVQMQEKSIRLTGKGR